MSARPDALVPYVLVPLGAEPEREALDAAAGALAPLFAGAVEGDRGERAGLFVASGDAGAATALRFWADAQRTGVALASPELFPWCLANAACGLLARRFGVRGPNATFLGGGDALAAAVEAAEDQLALGRVDAAVVVALEFGMSGEESGFLFAVRLDTPPDGLAAPAPCLPAGEGLTLHAAAALLRTALDAGRPVHGAQQSV